MNMLAKELLRIFFGYLPRKEYNSIPLKGTKIITQRFKADMANLKIDELPDEVFQKIRYIAMQCVDLRSSGFAELPLPKGAHSASRTDDRFSNVSLRLIQDYQLESGLSDFAISVAVK